jgi:hypothetical protein
LGAVWLRNWNWTASCTAIGSASSRQIAHKGVLFHQIRRERVRDADCFFEHKPDGRGCASRDAKGRVWFEVLGIARQRSCTWTICRGRVFSKPYEALLLLGRVDRPCALEVWYAAEAVRSASSRARRSRMVVLGPIEFCSLLLLRVTTRPVRNGKVFLPGVAVVMFGRIVLVLGSRGYRYACGARAAGLQALAGRSTSRRGVRRALKGIAPVGANLPGWRRVSACRCRVGRRAGQHWLYRNAREVGQWLEDALDTKTADVQAVEPLLLCAQGSRAEIW